MTWLLGIDEAGYGPNLGPLVMTCVACRVPEEIAGVDLWTTLEKAVCRLPAGSDDRLFINDSKVVHSASAGLSSLERNVLAVLSPPRAPTRTLRDYQEWLCPADGPTLGKEPWYTGSSRLPVAVKPDVLAGPSERYEAVCRERGISWPLVRSVVVCAEEFNLLTERAGSKGAVLAYGLTRLLREAWPVLEGNDDVFVAVDKHGGRNTYAAMLQDALPEGMVLVEEESRVRSVYRLASLAREFRLTVQPRADSEHFCVALASMVSKYLREVLMLEFNGFWQTHLPGLKPTAGYPGDASRFWQAIRPVVQRLGLHEDRIWRRK